MQLNVEQDKLIHARAAGHMLLKGVAGSGKTTVGVHRAIYLLKHYCIDGRDKVILVTYNKTLKNYINYLYDKIDSEEQENFQMLMTSSEGKLEIETIDSVMFKYAIRYIKENVMNAKVIDEKNPIKRKQMEQAILQNLKEYPDLGIMDVRYSQFFFDEIDWIRACKFMELSEYQAADRIGRTGKSGDGPQKLAKNSKVREAIYNVMQTYRKLMIKNKIVDFKEANLMALKQAQKEVTEKYTHIVVDESQDLSRVQLEFLKLLYKEETYSNIIFICDTAQSIYPHSWLKGRSFKSIGYDMTGKSNSLSKGYRNTAQILQSAYSLIQNDENITNDENFVKPNFVDKQGKYPIYTNFHNDSDEAEFVIGKINEFIASGYNYSDMAIIAKNKNQLDCIKDKCDNLKVPAALIGRENGNFKENSVRIMTIHAIKGLEFKIVFILGLNEGIIPFVTRNDIESNEIQEAMDRKLLYVGMTRANEFLYLSSSGRPSKFLREIDCRYLRMSSGSEIKPFYGLRTEDYYFKDKVLNIYSNEEKVRQWFIRELVETFKYPLSSIKIEYQVKSFSKTGFVDIAVLSSDNNNNNEPFVFVEVKPYGSGIKDAFEQLKSYMNVNRYCQYGVVTDGNSILFVDKDLKFIDTIPMSNEVKTAGGLYEFEYLSLQNNRKSTIIIDENDSSYMKMVDEYEEKLISQNDMTTIPVYSNIAAGAPILINDQIEDKFMLPIELLHNKQDCFMLKVKGDSMINANISDGDLVVIKKQSTAEMNEIVAADVDGEATLKRFSRMGGKILLIPENSKYEPILLEDYQVRIIGKAVGVLKRWN